VPYVLIAVLLAVVAARHGRPGVNIVREALAESIGKYTPEVLESGCTHVVGEYWHVWPTMFYTNLVLADRGEAPHVWGLAFRCRPTRGQWSGVPLDKTRVAEIIGDEPHVAATLARYSLPPLEVQQELQTIRVLRPVQSLAVTSADHAN
jgi:hypothetical protein